MQADQKRKPEVSGAHYPREELEEKLALKLEALWEHLSPQQ